MSTHFSLAAACLALVMLSLAVCLRLVQARLAELRAQRVGPQMASTSTERAVTFQDVRASDNFRNLFETPVLFYVLIALALATNRIPQWFACGCWAYVVTRFAHSLIHCTYNRVTHRFVVFIASLLLLIGMWVSFTLELLAEVVA